MARSDCFRGSTSRRDFLKLSVAGAAGATVGADWRLRKASAKPAQITFLRESSYVKEFDDYFKNVLIPRYQQDTGIKLVYEIAMINLWNRINIMVKAPVGAWS